MSFILALPSKVCWLFLMTYFTKEYSGNNALLYKWGSFKKQVIHAMLDCCEISFLRYHSLWNTLQNLSLEKDHNLLSRCILISEITKYEKYKLWRQGFNFRIETWVSQVCWLPDLGYYFLDQFAICYFFLLHRRETSYILRLLSLW